ncbi:putative TonB-dependent receptor [Sphingomonas changbaiensis NBRC 104936]|uniref:Putative TonB-dependent receptor n=1 Tax=Sphingomonas changbaiensis NBRC 104936 TaxID=1219043 RepID=A0A0E9MMC3_9SPHN|nr:TonB-dependent receptor [Sphingomonas changbaiensis]GAO38912.1 putative TonB-dependent receptor [Sphingomonas changbaiensis NBRC 104936]
MAFGFGGVSYPQAAGRIGRAALLTGAAILFPSMAMAQDVPAGAEAQAAADNANVADNSGEIVVTALKRDTRLQDTPIAISAVGGDSLQRGGTTSFTDLTRNAPSLRVVDGGPGNRRVILRGVTAAGEPTVGVYYDESPVSGSVGTTSDAAGSTPDFRLFDVERAEVLRGPQGTLYGSGSMGGTVRIIYEKPKADRLEAAMAGSLSAVQSGGVGGSVDAMINVPIVEDVVALRVVGDYNQFAGYVDNSYYHRNNINDGNSYGGRALLRITPTDALTVDFAAYYEKVATNSPRWIAETGQRYVTDGRSESGNYDKNQIYSGTLNYDFGPVALTAVSTYFRRDRTVVSDVSDTFNGRDNAAGCKRYHLANARACSPTELADYLDETNRILFSSLYQPQFVKNWTNELRLSSTGNGPFNWTVGVFSEDRKTEVRSTLLTADPRSGLLQPFVDENIFYDRTINDHLKQKAAFAELSYKFFDKLTLTAGARYYDFDKTVGGRVDKGQEHYVSKVTPFQEAESKEDGFVYKFNASYEINPDYMVYVQASQGFRPGGVNQVIGLPAALAAYSSDSLWNYEVGVKTHPLAGVYFNLTGYRIDWDNLQVSGRTSGTGSVFGLISNAGAARIEGVEAELSATPLAGFSLSANLGYTNARLSEDQVSEVVVATGRKGDRLAFVPRWNASGSAEYTWGISDTLDGIIRADAAYVGSSYSTLSQLDVYRRKVDAYELVNARIGLQAADSGWNAFLFVNNVFNAAAVNSRSSSSNTGGKTTVFSAPPRTFGISLLKRFR